jgi:hypothetical protein
MANNDKVDEISKMLESGVREVFESGKYTEYLTAMSRFHQYSARNSLLIYLQMPTATRIGSFRFWQDEFNRHVKKGEHGIRIFAPVGNRKRDEPVEMEKIDTATGLPVLDEHGQPVMETFIPASALRVSFRAVPVFDVSQTEGDPLPELIETLTGDVARYELFLDALRAVSPLPIVFEDLPPDVDGICHKDRIAIRGGMSEIQTVSAAIHELAHAKRDEQKTAEENGEQAKDDYALEAQIAESVSFVVCQNYGIETGANSFGYLANWAKSQELKDLNDSLNIIRKMASGLIDGIDEQYQALAQERGIDLTAEEKSAEPQTAEPALPEQTVVVPDAVAEPEPEPQDEMQKTLDTFAEKHGFGKLTAEIYSDTFTKKEPQSVMIREGKEGHMLLDRDIFEFSKGGKITAEHIAAYFSQLETSVAGVVVGHDDLTLHDIDIIKAGRDYRVREKQHKLGRDKDLPLPDVKNCGVGDTVLIYDPGTLQCSYMKIAGVEKRSVVLRSIVDSHFTTKISIARFKDGYGLNLMEGMKTVEKQDKTLNNRLYDKFTELFPEFMSGKYQHLRLKSPGLEPLSLEWIDKNSISVMHKYVQNGDLMYDPMVTFAVDRGAKTMTAAEFQQSAPPLYQQKQDNGKWLSVDGNGNQREHGAALGNEINGFAAQWFQNISEQGYMPVKATMEIDGADVDIAFDANGAPIMAEPEGSAVPQESEKPKQATLDLSLPDPTVTVAKMNEYGYTESDMYPLSVDRAVELFDTEHPIYLLYADNTETTVYDRDEIITFSSSGLCGITKADWETSPVRAAQLAVAASAENDRETDLLFGSENKFGIYQIKDGIDGAREFRFAPMRDLEARGLSPDRANYELVYTGRLDIHDTLVNKNKIFNEFQHDHPECPPDFTGRSVSPSDVIVLQWKGEVSAHYVDSAGFEKLPDFVGQRAKSAERPGVMERFDKAKKLNTQNAPAAAGRNNKERER